MEVARVREFAEGATSTLADVVRGQHAPIHQMVVALVAGGHVLLEGPPGIGKTLLVRMLAKLVRSEFRRVQFTPDLMPADLTGTSVFRPSDGSFEFVPGPLFTGVLLADEINRTPPKTQAALLEAMQEGQVTVDGTTRPLPAGFFVAATQNPIEFEGTYPLPEAQLDRFFMMIRLDYPDAAHERAILDAHGDSMELEPATATSVHAAVDVDGLGALRDAAARVYVEDSVRDYIVGLARASREHRRVAVGASSRAAVTLMFAAKSAAACAGREFVRPDDVQTVAPAVLRHRLVLRPEADLEGVGPDQVLDELLASTPLPRGVDGNEGPHASGEERDAEP